MASAPPVVLDAFAAEDRAWAYVDGRALRQAVLPDLLQAVSALRADVQVGLAAAASTCGFQPLLSIDEALLWIRWPDGRRPAWGAVLRTSESFDRETACLRALAPEARETVLDGRRAWQLERGFVVWDDGLFVVASSPFDAQATVARTAHPESAAIQARGALAGRLFAANILEPSPFDFRAFKVEWKPEPSGSRLSLSVDFATETSARQAESILEDGLRQLLGSNASFDASTQGAGELVVQRSTVQRSESTLAVAFELPPLAGRTALVSTLTSFAVRAVRLHTAWGLTAEARDTVFVIARALADYAVRSRAPGHAARFPPSAPLVPDDVPYGKRVVPNPHAFLHPSWQDIRYSSDRPTYYAYDFVTAKDGRSAVVRARGDIDGDGITSLFELDVRMDAHDVPVISPMIRERDPEE